MFAASFSQYCIEAGETRGGEIHQRYICPSVPTLAVESTYTIHTLYTGNPETWTTTLKVSTHSLTTTTKTPAERPPDFPPPPPSPRTHVSPQSAYILSWRTSGLVCSSRGSVQAAPCLLSGRAVLPRDHRPGHPLPQEGGSPCHQTRSLGALHQAERCTACQPSANQLPEGGAPAVTCTRWSR